MSQRLSDAARSEGVSDHDLQDRAASTLRAIGARVRELRMQRGLTLKAVSELTGLSPSLLSLVERGKTSPSIGTLVAVTYALDVHMADLVPGAADGPASPVVRAGQQQVVSTPEGVTRRVLRDDRVRGLEIAVNEYVPGGRSADQALHHGGYEYGYVLDGTLTIDIDGESHVLEPGDSIAYDSTRPHRIINESDDLVRAMWVNLDRRWDSSVERQ